MSLRDTILGSRRAVSDKLARVRPDVMHAATRSATIKEGRAAWRRGFKRRDLNPYPDHPHTAMRRAWWFEGYDDALDHKLRTGT